MKIGLIRLGKMGGNMVERLLLGAHEVVVFDRSKEAIEEAVKKKSHWRHFSWRSGCKAAGTKGGMAYGALR